MLTDHFRFVMPCNRRLDKRDIVDAIEFVDEFNKIIDHAADILYFFNRVQLPVIKGKNRKKSEIFTADCLTDINEPRFM